MKTSELLRRAKGHLEHERYVVCYSLEAAARSYPYHESAQADVIAQRVINRIRNALKPHQLVSQWLAHKHRVPRQDLTFAALHDYRQRWLDALIAEYEAKGD